MHCKKEGNSKWSLARRYVPIFKTPKGKKNPKEKDRCSDRHKPNIHDSEIFSVNRTVHEAQRQVLFQKNIPTLKIRK